MLRHRGTPSILGFLLVCLVAAWPALSHPLGNFSIDHYSRIRVTPQALRLRYVIDMAEIPTFQELQDADVDGDRQVSPNERQAFAERMGKALTARLTATLNGTPLAWRVESTNLTAPSSLAPPAAGSPPATLRIVLDLRAEFTVPITSENRLRYADGNHPGRTGWKEIVVEAGDEIRLMRSSASRTDLSRELTQYPPSVSAPPQDVTAEFTFATGSGGGWRAFVPRFRDEDYIWLMVVAAALGLVARWRAGRIPGRRS